jgi:predicted amidohydrolase
MSAYMNKRPLPRTLAALLILSATSAAQMRAALSQSTLIQDVTLISPERASPMSHTDVLLENGKIAKIGRKVVAGLNVQRIDGSGRFLIPGLIDSHVRCSSTA